MPGLNLNRNDLPRFELVRDDVVYLLKTDITYPGWETEIGRKKAFYVRGFTWFRREVLKGDMTIMDCANKFAPQVVLALEALDGWRKHNEFEWLGKFAPRQFIDAASGTAGQHQFSKAASVILCCEIAARALGVDDPTRPNPADVYDRMRIEPAVSYIHGYNRGMLTQLEAEDFEMLRRWTGQRSNDVFFDMADGATVTDKLARRLRKAFRVRFPKVSLGEVDCRFSKKQIYNPSRAEWIDVDENELVAEARQV